MTTCKETYSYVPTVHDLVKLRLDLKVVDIAFRFNIYCTCVKILYYLDMFFVSSFKGNRLDA